MTEHISAIAAIIEAHEPNTVGPDGICTVGCTECDWTPGSPESFSEHVARIIVDTMGEQPTCKTLPDGTKEWRLDGELHRVDGSAVEYADGSKEWYLNGELHRVDGPAVEYADGGKAWYLNGKRLTEAEHAQRTA